MYNLGPIRATAPMWRCSKIMHMQRDLHPTVLSSLEGIVDQMVWFRENWYEEVLRQLKAGLAKCYAISFDNRNDKAPCRFNCFLTVHLFAFFFYFLEAVLDGFSGNLYRC